VSDISTTTTLYVYRDARSLVVYVGITGRGVKRSIQHADSSPWWPYVETAHFEHYPDLPSAQKAEAQAIRRHRPPFNIIHNMDWEEMRAVYLLWRSSADRMVCESDGTSFTFDITPMNERDGWALLSTARKASNRILIGDSCAATVLFGADTLTFIAKQPQPAGRFRLIKHFYDPVQRRSAWTVDRVPSLT
jgi:hypothetical protein